MRRSCILFTVGVAIVSSRGWAQQPPTDQPYKVVRTAKVGGEGSFDYLLADSVGRRLYIPRSSGANSRVTVFDLDSLKSVGAVATTGVRGTAVDPKSGHGFTSSKPVVMFDTKSLATIKTIEVQGNPDGILFDPTTEQVFVFSHSAPHATVIKAADGSVAGTIALGGAPEQAVSDGMGQVYVAIEDKDKVAVVDAKALKMTAQYDLGGKGGTPAGLALDVKNHILFACCRKPQAAVILNSDDGKIITSLPIGGGTDGAVFNPKTMEAFSSQRDGTLTVIKEKSPTDFVVEQNVTTMPGAKTLTLDSNTNQIYLIAAELVPPPAQGEAQSGGRGTRGGGRRMVPDSFTIIVVGR
jgi:hypothetical protein